METEALVQAALEGTERLVSDGVRKGLPRFPSTPLELHAFELGRLSVLKWLAPAATVQVRDE